VRRLAGDELEIVLVLDTSGSMAGAPLEAAKEAAAGFVEKAPTGTRMAVVTFGGEPRVVSGFSTDRPALTAALRSVGTRPGTALYGGLTLATGLFRSGSGAQRSIVLLADGDDTAGGAELATLDRTLGERSIQLDAVAFSTSYTDEQALRRLAAAGGGRVLTARDASALVGIYEQLAASLVDRYSLSWRSEATGRTTVRVRLQADDVTAERRIVIDVPGARTVRESPFSSGWVLAAGAACLYLSLFVGGRTALVRGRPRARVPFLAGARSSTPSVLSRAGDKGATFAEHALDRWGQQISLNRWLERAGVVLRPGEFLVLVGSVAAGAFLVASLLGGPVLGLAAVAMTVLVCRLVLSFRADRRRAAFTDQLGDTLQLLAGSLRAGYGLLQAIDAVAHEAEEPTRAEFRRLVIETRLGRDLGDALHSMADRVGGEDLHWVVQAIEIHREVGGDLAQVLDTVAGTIRERNQLHRQVRALSAEGRLSANVLMALPIFLVVVIRATNPGYLAELGSGAGLLMAVAATVAVIAGAIWLRRMCRLVY
jgi:tight adherence protein B